MADRIPLVVDSSSQQIKELPTGDSLILSDNEKLIFGDSSDLQIYHDVSGNHSYITESGTGDFFIQGNNLIIENTGGENYFRAVNGGAVQLYYSGSEKLATTSTGIDVTGDIVLGDTNPQITFNDSSTVNLQHLIVSSSDKLLLSADHNNVDAGTKIEFAVDGTERMEVNSTGIDVTGKIVASTSAAITQVALTSSSNAVAWDARAAANAYHLLTENTTFAAPSNAVEGAIISVEIAQGGTPYTVAWNTVFEFAASTAPTMTATANKTDILSFRYNGSIWQEIGRVQNLAQT